MRGGGEKGKAGGKKGRRGKKLEKETEMKRE